MGESAQAARSSPHLDEQHDGAGLWAGGHGRLALVGASPVPVERREPTLASTLQGIALDPSPRPGQGCVSGKRA